MLAGQVQEHNKVGDGGESVGNRIRKHASLRENLLGRDNSEPAVQQNVHPVQNLSSSFTFCWFFTCNTHLNSGEHGADRNDLLVGEQPVTCGQINRGWQRVGIGIRVVQGRVAGALPTCTSPFGYQCFRTTPIYLFGLLNRSTPDAAPRQRHTAEKATPARKRGVTRTAQPETVLQIPAMAQFLAFPSFFLLPSSISIAFRFIQNLEQGGFVMNTNRQYTRTGPQP